MRVEIWSDVYCPWCYIGKRRFERALEHFEHRDEVEVVWRSFQLDPSAPQEYEGSATERLMEKYRISRSRAEQMHEHVTSLAAQEGLEYRMDKVRPGNSFDAHRVLHLAKTHGLGDEMEERLFRAYFTEGLSVGDHDTLVRLATEVGLDAEEVRGTLASDAFAEEVRADQEQAYAYGSRGVPFFIFGQRYAVSGAQPVELFQEALEQTWEAMQPEIGR